MSEDIEGNIFNAFFGAAYSVILFGPITLPMTKDDFLNANNFIPVGIVYGIFIGSFWLLIKNSTDWSNEGTKSVGTHVVDSTSFNISKNKKMIKQCSNYIFIIIPGAATYIGLLNVYQIAVWMFTIMTVLNLQHWESSKLFDEFAGGL